jgi:transcriptional regulator with XRE-family HTH domain
MRAIQRFGKQLQKLRTRGGLTQEQLAVTADLRGADLRKLIDVPRVSFESMMRKRARTALAMFSGKS